jgi:hypothetical protein
MKFDIQNLLQCIQLCITMQLPLPSTRQKPLIHHQELQDFPNMSQVSLQKNNKNQLSYIIKHAENVVPVHAHTHTQSVSFSLYHLNSVSNKSVYRRFSSRWFYYTTTVTVLQSITIKLNTEYYFTVDVDLLVLHSSLTVLKSPQCPFLAAH